MVNGADDDEENKTEDRRDLKAKIALEAVREQSERGRSGASAMKFTPNQIYAWNKQLLEQAAPAFDGGAGQDAEASRDREIEKLHEKIG